MDEEPPLLSAEELAHVLEMERVAEEFRTSYGLGPDDIWSDDLMNTALADHGFPALATLPDEPRGIMLAMATPDERNGQLSAEDRRRWQRVNGMHLLAHAMLHANERCPGCTDW